MAVIKMSVCYRDGKLAPNVNMSIDFLNLNLIIKIFVMSTYEILIINKHKMRIRIIGIVCKFL